MRWDVSLALGIIVLVAGCTVGPFAGSSTQDTPVTVALGNSANNSHSYTLEVWLVPRDSKYTNYRSDGNNVTTGISRAGSSTHSSGPYHDFTKIELVNSARLHGRYTYAPGEFNHTSIRNFSSDAVVFIKIFRGERIPEYVTFNCSGTLELVEVAMRYYGSDSAIICEPHWF